MTEILHIYTRVSSTVQEEEGTSLDTQQQLGIERAEKLGMGHRIWNEGAQSSSKDDLSNRPILAELLGQIDDGEVKHIYVWNTDRLSRNLNTWGMIRFKLIQNDVRLHTPTGEQILSDAQTNMMLGILSEISQYDNQIRTERFRLGKLNKIRSGGWMGGPPPFGYKIVDSHLVENPDESLWVKSIYEWFKGGDSVDSIRDKLLKNAVMTRRGNAVWSHGSINKLLQNTHYGGYYKYTDSKSGETITVQCPEILPKSLVKDVSDAREKRGYKTGGHRSKTSNQKHAYLLTGLLYCGHCGSRYGGNFKKSQTSYYSCNQKTNKFKTKHTDQHFECSSQRNARIDRTDEAIWRAITEVLSESHIFKETVKVELMGGASSYKEDTKNIEAKKKKISKLEDDIEKVTQSIIDVESARLIGERAEVEALGIIRNLEKHRLNCEAKIEELVEDVTNSVQKRKWIDWVGEFGNRLDAMNDPKLPIEEKKRFLEGVVERITLTNISKQEHTIDIEFRLPYVNDKFKWHADRRDGYVISDGEKHLIWNADLLKKTPN